jgi:hypothetical protein
MAAVTVEHVAIRLLAQEAALQHALGQLSTNSARHRCERQSGTTSSGRPRHRRPARPKRSGTSVQAIERLPRKACDDGFRCIPMELRGHPVQETGCDDAGNPRIARSRITQRLADTASAQIGAPGCSVLSFGRPQGVYWTPVRCLTPSPSGSRGGHRSGDCAEPPDFSACLPRRRHVPLDLGAAATAQLTAARIVLGRRRRCYQWRVGHFCTGSSGFADAAVKLRLAGQVGKSANTLLAAHMPTGQIMTSPAGHTHDKRLRIRRLECPTVVAKLDRREHWYFSLAHVELAY